MSSYIYLISLIISISGLLVIDRRFKLAFWLDKKRTIITISASVLLFVFWDFLGIIFGIFRIGDSEFMTGIHLFSEFPIEEIFFLILLTYLALLLHQGVKKL